MSELLTIPIEKIKPNPFRLLEKYPYSEEKLDSLIKSIEATGFWEGVIARRNNDEYQLAFGHHRVEAARRAGLQEIPLVVRELSDERMLQMFGRENLEDYHTSFPVLLETWEATLKFLTDKDKDKKAPSTIDVARFLGWTYVRKDGRFEGTETLNNAAKATSAALCNINVAQIEREDFQGLNTSAAMHLTSKARALLNQVEQTAQTQNLSNETVEQAKQQIVKAVKKTAEQSRTGSLATDKISTALEINTYQFSQEAKKKTPLFSMFGKQTAETIRKMLFEDATGERLDQISKAISEIELEEDEQIIKRIDFELAQLAERVEQRRKQISNKSAKVVPLKLITTKGA